MAIAASKTTNATQEMKMNMIFWDSSMPNQISVKGTMADIGTLRPKIVIGAKKALNHGQVPQTMPSGTPISAASPKPWTTRQREIKMLRVSALSNQSVLKDWTHSSGEQRTAGEMTRASGAPLVRTYQTT